MPRCGRSGRRCGSDPHRFVATVADRWAAEPAPAGDPTARAEVEALCAQAQRAIAAGDVETAKRILADAAARNARARSPLVPHYVANVAVLSNELFTAVSAQKEALRLDPRNRLYRENLVRLLTRPYAPRLGAQGPAG